MNISCCCNKSNLNWFNNGNNLITISSDFIAYQKYTKSSCKAKFPKCYPSAKNQNNSSSYTSSLKANVIYPSYYQTCKCICVPKK